MIVVKDLVKAFGDKIAVDHVSFSVGKGEILGFLGPNGAGKSTTMKIITGFLNATEGDVEVNGVSVRDNAQQTKKMIGYLPETAASYPEMNVTEFLEFVGEVRGYRDTVLRTRVEAVIEKCHLESVRYQTIDTLSKGYRQRVAFAQAILHDPPILILDEPTDGLDPNQKHEVRNIIQEMGKDKCIILSTHILEEVDAVCSRMIIISNGKITADGTPDEIRGRSLNSNVIDMGIHQVNSEAVSSKLKEITSLDRVEVLTGKDASMQRFRLYPKNRENILPAVSSLIVKEGWVVEELAMDHGRLDDVFRTLTTEDR
jgi:ABC-2 type transport system ATP-binding protein